MVGIRHVKLGRKKETRKALFRNLAISLILHEKINTTQVKAKALKPRIECLVEIAKKGDFNAKRQLTRALDFPPAVLKMTKVIGPRYRERVGGYVRVLRLGERRGDNAPLAQISFVESKNSPPQKEVKEKA